VVGGGEKTRWGVELGKSEGRVVGGVGSVGFFWWQSEKRSEQAELTS